MTGAGVCLAGNHDGTSDDRELPPAEPTAQPISGASIASDHIAIVTVEGNAVEGFRLCLQRSAQIELEDREQESLVCFGEALSSFLKEARITRVALRSLPKTGKCRTGLGFKIEAALQMVPGVTVDLVHFNTVSAWKNHSGELAPRPIAGLVGWEEKLHAFAIETACMASMRWSQVNSDVHDQPATKNEHQSEVIPPIIHEDR